MFRIKIAMHRTFFKHYESFEIFFVTSQIKKTQY